MKYIASIFESTSALLLAGLLTACAQPQLVAEPSPAAPAVSAAPATPAISVSPVTPVMTKAKQQGMSADQALQRLKDGNARFVAGKMKKRDLRVQVKQTGANGQYPIASVVSCIDSRAAPSLVFDQGIGDIFTASVAGNVINDDIAGSLEYTAKAVGTKLIVVLGHTHCGAVKGACDGASLGKLTQLLQKIRPAVDATPSLFGPDRSSKNSGFVDAVAHSNVKLQVKELLARSAVLREMVDKGEVKVVGAMLDVETGKVQFE
jgi:carbonic anhydrase